MNGLLKLAILSGLMALALTGCERKPGSGTAADPGTKAANPLLGEWLVTSSKKDGEPVMFRFFEDGTLETQRVDRDPLDGPLDSFLFDADYSKTPIAITLTNRGVVYAVDSDEPIKQPDIKATFSILSPGKAELQLFGEENATLYLSLNTTKTSRDLLSEKLKFRQKRLAEMMQARDTLSAKSQETYEKEQFTGQRRGAPKTQQQTLKLMDSEIQTVEAEIEAISRRIN